MAFIDIVTPIGDSQDFILEIPEGSSSAVPSDILINEGEALLLTEIPEVTSSGSGGNIFIMSE